MWNERYDSEEYIFGTESNGFLVDHAHLLEGPILSIAEGEGRNAVFLAARGLNVLGVDGSEVGLNKAKRLAKSKGVTIETQVADLAAFVPEEDTYGAVVSIFAHLPSELRGNLYPRLVKSLKAGGIMLLEAYSEDQLSGNTGGPKNLDSLMTKGKVENEFPDLDVIVLRKIEREVIEGRYHTGLASVVQYIGQKKA
ncbi:MAG: class I SAM-dependent methyltransferase [Chloroflexota bacterium]